MEEKLPELIKIYNRFESKVHEYKKEAACDKGCAYCCKEAGRIDATTLEGLAVKKAVDAFPKPRQKTLTKLIQKEIKKRENGTIVACPFLMKNNACMIYEVRPFSCRRIYSTHICNVENPPMVNRKVMETADEAIRDLRALDENGYSGHLTFILSMLTTPAFTTTYLKGEFKPEAIMEYGKSHKISINKMML